jgi:tubulin polyglutamylase TTLL6/13
MFDDAVTQYPVVTEVAENLDWKIQYSNDAGDWDVYWTDFAIDPDILIKMHLFQKINHYPGIHVIARKNLLGLNLMSLRNKFPEEYNFFPLTWMLPLQYAEFRAYYETKPKGKARTYIAKPEAECQGRGIFLTRKIEDL